jgi:hypothetical protein
MHQSLRAATRVALALASVSLVAVLGTPHQSASAAERPHTLALTTSINPQTHGNNSLQAISCASGTFCMAVGYETTSYAGHDRTLAERWNGTAWVVVPTPNVGTSDNILYGVSCMSTSFCVGGGEAGHHSLLEKWNGTTWTVMTHADPGGTTTAILNGVSCTYATLCQAVGFWRSTGHPNRLLADHWTGTHWVIETEPAPHPGVYEWFTSVSCHQKSFCMAVGLAETAHDVTIAERWNGTHWVTTPSLNPSSFDDFWSVSCVTSAFCMAVGDQGPPANAPNLGLAERWNGSTWTTQTVAPVVGSPDDILFGVACNSTTDCEAVGDSDLSHGADLAEHSSGGAFSLVTTPSPGPDSNLFGVSFPRPTFLMADGQQSVGSAVPLFKTIAVQGP